MTVPPRHPSEELIARVSRARWGALLRVYGGRLRREDVEDCLAQATLELVMQARRGRIPPDTRLITVALENKVKSRIIDRYRAIGGRSPATAVEYHATQIDTVTDLVADRHDTPTQVIARDELHHLICLYPSLTPDQRQVIRYQLDGQQGPAAFCAEHGWTIEKYRKVGQRARARLAILRENDRA